MSTLILTHGDCDGICGGAIARAACGKSRVIFTNPIALLQDLAAAEKHDRVVISDVAIDLSAAGRLRAAIDGIARGRDVIYLDHHPLPPGFAAPWLVHEAGACGSLLAYAHFAGQLPQDLSRVALYGAIGDYRDDARLAKKLVGYWDKRTLYYEAGTLSQGIEMERRNYGFKLRVLDWLAANRIPSEMPDLAARAVEASRLEDEMRERVERSVISLANLAYVINPDGFIAKAAIYARAYGGRPVGVSAEYRPRYRAYDFSVRSEKDANLNVLLNAAAAPLGGHGGGHPQAGGGRVPAKKLKAFLADLDRALGRPGEIAAAAAAASGG